MVRISDIFKRPGAGNQQHPPETKPKEEPLKKTSSEELKPDMAPPSPGISADKVAAQKEPAPTQNNKQESIAKPKAAPIDSAHSKNLYLLGIQLVKELFKNAEQLKSVNLIQIKQWVNQITNYLISGDTELLNLFYSYVSENYLYEHMVNSTIMSIELGIGLDYNEAQLNELGLAAFLHDIGMVKTEHLEMQPRGLSEEEYNQIKDHPLYGADMLSKIQDISDAVIYVAKEEHERQDGSGYPKGTKNGEISEYGRIVAIVDVYEALTHDRPYRKRKSPHDAVKELISKESIFDPMILKAMIKKIGVYPISSWVELNSSEVGRVMTANEEFPLRPKLKIFFDAKKHPIKVPRLVNLAEQFNLFIKKSFSEEDLVKDAKGRVEF